MCELHGKWLKRPCTLCGAVAYCCGAVALGVTAALLGRFLPRLGPLLHQKRPFFLCASFCFDVRSEASALSPPIADNMIVRRNAGLFRRGLERAEIGERNRGGQHVGEN